MMGKGKNVTEKLYLNHSLFVHRWFQNLKSASLKRNVLQLKPMLSLGPHMPFGEQASFWSDIATVILQRKRYSHLLFWALRQSASKSEEVLLTQFPACCIFGFIFAIPQWCGSCWRDPPSRATRVTWKARDHVVESTGHGSAQALIQFSEDCCCY